MALYCILIDDRGETVDKVEFEAPHLRAARREATVFVGEMLRDRPDAFWDVAAWTITVTDETGACHFRLTLEGHAAPAAIVQLRAAEEATDADTASDPGPVSCAARD